MNITFSNELPTFKCNLCLDKGCRNGSNCPSPDSSPKSRRGTYRLSDSDKSNKSTFWNKYIFL